jgi:branched-chain amino acid transport system substrate-binding protein
MRGNNVNRKHHVRALAGLAVMALVAASCGSDSDSSSDSDAPADTEAAVETTTADTEPADTEPADTEPTDTEPTDTTAQQGGEGFAALPPPDGEPISVGMVNTVGVPGLDFPEIATASQATAEYLNLHGGLGGRPIELEICEGGGTPETSQACAQELTGKGVEMIYLGLDLFAGFDTFTSASIPVVGVLPILPSDYTANALYMTGGNTTTVAAMAKFAVEEFGAATAGIISADNAGANGTEAALKAALDKAGITYTSVKGGDNETDAGYQGLMSQATADDPDVLFSLYADAGCIGTMRGRVSLGIDTPVITTNICAADEVISQVGDDAFGWYFIGGQTEETGTPERADTDAVVELAGAEEPAELGLGLLWQQNLFALALIANTMADEGEEITGASLYERLATSTEFTTWPNEFPLACGDAPSIPNVCSFAFPVGEYVGDGTVETVPGYEELDVRDFL